MKVRFSLIAQAELRSALAYVAGHNPQAARRMRQSLMKAVATLEDFPLRGQQVGSGETRRLVSGRYLIFYELLDREVLIAHIVHGSRKLAAELSE